MTGNASRLLNLCGRRILAEGLPVPDVAVSALVIRKKLAEFRCRDQAGILDAVRSEVNLRVEFRTENAAVNALWRLHDHQGDVAFRAKIGISPEVVFAEDDLRTSMLRNPRRHHNRYDATVR